MVAAMDTGRPEVQRIHVDGLASEVSMLQHPERVASGCTGFRIWSSALLLANELAQTPDIVRGRTVVELGCGCGLAGIVAALCGASVVLTDRDEECVELARESAEANATEIAAAGGHVECAVLDWEWPEVTQDEVPRIFGNTDVVIASDPLYSATTIKALPRAATALLAPRGTLLCFVGVRKSCGGRATIAQFMAQAYSAGLAMLGEERSVVPTSHAVDVAKGFWTDRETIESSDSEYILLEFSRSTRSDADVAKEAARQSAREAEVLETRRAKNGVAIDAPAYSNIQPPLAPGQKYKLCSVCRRIGHGTFYCEVLLRRPDWKLHPNTKWFESEDHIQYFCPEGNILVDFCDEMHFSRLCMFLKGRQCLENKARLGMLVPHLMPETFHIVDRQWVDGRCPVDREGEDALPWFVKEAEGNEGTFVECCDTVAQCMILARPGKNYVVQQHVRDQLLYEGRKFHLRLHALIICMEDGVTWRLYTYKDGYLNIAPNHWSPADVSRDTQVVIYRSRRIGDWEHWPNVYPKCKASFTEVVVKAVVQGKLEGRLGKKQFEIASMDYMVDTHGEVWLIECNMGPVLRDAYTDPELNDDAMVTSAFEIIVPHEDTPKPGQWDFAGEFIGPKPLSEDQPDEVVQDEAVSDVMSFLDAFA
eukprot:TRINITY_DN41713_c0_g1_i1.p1 TRINITY_DN41713_c0_g1~~TRINITY_DN41713_c0_g1_i1.p1  ORF type:complete len:649 (+),score=93.12 TRINITY_DN41713_c0_g1_i1:71-2017(+)